MARDTIHLINEIRTTSDKIYLLGQNLGSYISHRVLQMNSSIVDALVMDSVCANPFCNLTTADTNRDTMGSLLIRRCNQTVCAGMENFLDYLFTNPPIVCGADFLISNFQAQMSSYLFYSPLHITLPSVSRRLQRCSMYDFGSALAIMKQAASIYSLNMSPLLAHVLLTEFGRDLNANIANQMDSNAFFTTYTTSFLANLLASGWKVPPLSPYTQVFANFTKPMLLLNGEFDPYVPLSNAKLFSNQYNSSNQQMLIFNGVGSNTIQTSVIRDNRTALTCATQIILQFFSSPTSTLNTTCMNSTLPIDFTDNGYLFAGNVWDGQFGIIPLEPNQYLNLVLCYAIFIIACTQIMLLIAFRNKQPVKSRFLTPFLGTMFVICDILYVTIQIETISNLAYPPYYVIWEVIESVFVSFIALLYFFQTTRYYLMRYVYRMMASSQAPRKLLHLFTSKKIFIAVVLFYTAFCISYAVIVCSTYAIYGYVVTSYVSLLPIILGALANIAVLIMLAIDTFKGKCTIVKSCSWRAHFIIDDPLLFRIESMLTIPTVISAISANLCNEFIGSDSYPTVFLSILFYISVLLQLGGITCIAVIVNFAQSGRKVTSDSTVALDNVNNSEQFITTVLGEETGMILVTKYTEREFSYENLALWKDICKLLLEFETLGKEERKHGVKEIYGKYIDSSSRFEVNIPNDTKKMFTESLEEPRADALILLRGAIVVNLQDTFSRLIKTAEFINFWENMKAGQALKQQSGFV
jgi:pimeloyl-ACP methyl ester carboxylesterase